MSARSPNKENVHLGLAQEARWVGSIIDSLLNVQQDDMQQADDPLSAPTHSAVPRTAIARAAAVGFFEQNKYGALLSVSKSRGVVFANLGWKAGVPKWSAPVFVEMSTAGIGLSLGYETIMSCVALNTPESMDEFTSGRPVVGFELRLQAGGGAAAADGDGELALGGDAMGEDEMRVYSVAQGRLLDVSMQGGSMAPSADNERYYGRGATAELLLKGEAAQAPREFKAVYETLTRMAQEGALVVQKLRDQGVKIYPVMHSQPGWRSTY